MAVEITVAGSSIRPRPRNRYFRRAATLLMKLPRTEGGS